MHVVVQLPRRAVVHEIPGEPVIRRPVGLQVDSVSGHEVARPRPPLFEKVQFAREVPVIVVLLEFVPAGELGTVISRRERTAVGSTMEQHAVLDRISVPKQSVVEVEQHHLGHRRLSSGAGQPGFGSRESVASRVAYQASTR